MRFRRIRCEASVDGEVADALGMPRGIPNRHRGGMRERDQRYCGGSEGIHDGLVPHPLGRHASFLISVELESAVGPHPVGVGRTHMTFDRSAGTVAV